MLEPDDQTSFSASLVWAGDRSIYQGRTWQPLAQLAAVCNSLHVHVVGSITIVGDVYGME